MMIFKRYFDMRIDDFGYWCCIYFVVSAILFVITSGGWITMIYTLVGGIYFTLMLVITIGAIKRNMRAGKKVVRIPLLPAKLLLALQVFLLLFNFGDCGDSTGLYQFIQKIGSDFWNPGFCIKQPLFNSELLVQLFAALVVAYAVFLTMLVVHICPEDD